MSPEGLGVDRITTARLTGRRPEADDLGAYMDFFCDPRIEEELWPSAMRTPERAQEVLEGHIGHWDRWGFGPWAVLLGGRVVGWCGLSHTTIDGRPEVELMWFMHPDHWRHGYSTEIAREAVRVAFEVLELDDVVAFTTTGNVASRTVMDKLGMAYEADIEHVGMPHVLYRLKR